MQHARVAIVFMSLYVCGCVGQSVHMAYTVLCVQTLHAGLDMSAGLHEVQFPEMHNTVYIVHLSEDQTKVFFQWHLQIICTVRPMHYV